jgi:hypothetical protein
MRSLLAYSQRDPQTYPLDIEEFMRSAAFGLDLATLKASVTERACSHGSRPTCKRCC